jgi:hypothetical protein
LLDQEDFKTLLEAKVLIERWRRKYNNVPRSSSLRCRPLAPEEYARMSAGSGPDMVFHPPMAAAGTAKVT